MATLTVHLPDDILPEDDEIEVLQLPGYIAKTDLPERVGMAAAAVHLHIARTMGGLVDVLPEAKAE